MMDLCSMSSDMLRFLRMGFLFRLTSDSDLDRVELDGSV